MSRIAVYPGTFDPLTRGHQDLVRRAARLFERVIVAVHANPGKAPMLTLDIRVDLAARLLRGLPNVTVLGYSGLTTELARQQGATVLVRGVRASADLEFELKLASMSRCLAPEIETVFLSPSEQFTFLSSTLVREIAAAGGNLQEFVDPIVATELKRHRRS